MVEGWAYPRLKCRRGRAFRCNSAPGLPGLRGFLCNRSRAEGYVRLLARCLGLRFSLRKISPSS